VMATKGPSTWHWLYVFFVWPAGVGALASAGSAIVGGAAGAGVAAAVGAFGAAQAAEKATKVRARTERTMVALQMAEDQYLAK
jgi:hypothetical protein